MFKAIKDVVQNYQSSGEDVTQELTFTNQVLQYILNCFCARFTNILVSGVSCSILHPSLVTMKHFKSNKIIITDNFIIDEMIEMEEVRSTPPLQDGNDVFDMNLSQNKGIYLINELLVTDSNSMGDDYLTGSLDKT